MQCGNAVFMLFSVESVDQSFAIRLVRVAESLRINAGKGLYVFALYGFYILFPLLDRRGKVATIKTRSNFQIVNDQVPYPRHIVLCRTLSCVICGITSRLNHSLHLASDTLLMA